MPCHYFVIYRIYVTLHFLPIFAVAVVVVVVVLITNFHCFSVFCLFLIRYHLERLCKMCLIIVYMWTLWFYSDFIKTIYNKITYQKHSIMNLVGTSSKMKKKYSEKRKKHYLKKFNNHDIRQLILELWYWHCGDNIKI